MWSAWRLNIYIYIRLGRFLLLFCPASYLYYLCSNRLGDFRFRSKVILSSVLSARISFLQLDGHHPVRKPVWPGQKVLAAGLKVKWSAGIGPLTGFQCDQEMEINKEQRVLKGGNGGGSRRKNTYWKGVLTNRGGGEGWGLPDGPLSCPCRWNSQGLLSSMDVFMVWPVGWRNAARVDIALHWTDGNMTLRTWGTFVQA